MDMSQIAEEVIKSVLTERVKEVVPKLWDLLSEEQKTRISEAFSSALLERIERKVTDNYEINRAIELTVLRICNAELLKHEEYITQTVKEVLEKRLSEATGRIEALTHESVVHLQRNIIASVISKVRG